MENMNTELRFQLEHAHFASSRSSQPASARMVAPLGRWVTISVIATGVWALVEAPFEIWGVAWGPELAACLFSKLLWVGLIVALLFRIRTAMLIYAFLCALSVVAVGFSLPAELRTFPIGFGLSLAECVLKAAALGLLLRRVFE